jgi:hypothetical protein
METNVVEEVHALGRVLVLGMLALIGCGVLTAIFAGRGARGKQRLEEQMERVLGELADVNARLNDLDERLVDMTLMMDDIARPVLEERPRTRD